MGGLSDGGRYIGVLKLLLRNCRCNRYSYHVDNLDQELFKLTIVSKILIAGAEVV